MKSNELDSNYISNYHFTFVDFVNFPSFEGCNRSSNFEDLLKDYNKKESKEKNIQLNKKEKEKDYNCDNQSLQTPYSYNSQNECDQYSNSSYLSSCYDNDTYFSI